MTHLKYGICNLHCLIKFNAVRDNENPLYPRFQTVNIGDNAEFKCGTKNHKKWTFENSELPDNVLITGKDNETIKIQNVQLSNSGIYRCIYTDYNDLDIVEKGQLAVTGNHCY